MPELQRGRKLVVNSLPAGLLDGLAEEDQAAIWSIIGQPVTLAGYNYNQAELVFVDAGGTGHSIWVEPSLIQAA